MRSVPPRLPSGWRCAVRLCYDLTPEEMTDGKLADLARQLGHPSLATLLNSYNWWALSTQDVEQALADELQSITK